MTVSKYSEDKWGWDPKFVPRYWVFGLWGYIASIGDASKARAEVFREGVGFVIGEGRHVCFCFDD